jgi:DNA invertase Pin-like site-specific DNA recombinase
MSKRVAIYSRVSTNDGQQTIDTSTPSGRAMFGMLGVFAEFERAMISERVKAGLARSTKKGGRPPIDYLRKQKILRLLDGGLSINQTARNMKVGVATVHRIKTAMADAA